MNKIQLIGVLILGLPMIMLWQCNPGTKISNDDFPISEHLVARAEGFQIETVKRGDGEWLSMTKDAQGRLDSWQAIR